MRQLVAVGAAGVVAAIGALMVGEYPFTGVMPYITGVLFGLVVAEVLLAVARRGSAVLAAIAAVAAAGGVAYAVWDDSGYGIRPIGASAWVAIALAGAVAGVVVLRRTPRHAGT